MHSYNTSENLENSKYTYYFRASQDMLNTFSVTYSSAQFNTTWTGVTTPLHGAHPLIGDSEGPVSMSGHVG